MTVFMFYVGLHYSTEGKNTMQPTVLGNTIGSIWELFNDFQESLLLKEICQ